MEDSTHEIQIQGKILLRKTKLLKKKKKKQEIRSAKEKNIGGNEGRY